MKWIKLFEELRRETYLSAAKELDELGHVDRAMKLKKWATKIGSEQKTFKINDIEVVLSFDPNEFVGIYNNNLNISFNVIKYEDLKSIIKIDINYTIKDDDIKIKDIVLDTNLKIGRKEALTIKRMLVESFSEDCEIIHDKYLSLYDIINKTVFVNTDIPAEYNFYMEDILQDLQNYSVNKLFKE